MRFGMTRAQILIVLSTGVPLTQNIKIDLQNVLKNVLN